MNVKSVSQLYTTPWMSIHHQNIPDETIVAQKGLTEFISLVHSKVIKLVLPGRSCGGNGVEFDAPIPFYQGMLALPPGCTIYIPSPETWWTYIDGQTGLCGGPKLLVSKWLVPSHCHVTKDVPGSHWSFKG